MDKEALKLALEALESCGSGHITDGGSQWYDEKLVDNSITAIKEALAQLEQEPDDVTQWKALLENEYKQRMFLQWQLDRLMEQMLPINDDFIDDVLEDDDFERSKRMAFLQGVRWREAMYKIQ